MWIKKVDGNTVYWQNRFFQNGQFFMHKIHKLYSATHLTNAIFLTNVAMLNVYRKINRLSNDIRFIKTYCYNKWNNHQTQICALFTHKNTHIICLFNFFSPSIQNIVLTILATGSEGFTVFWLIRSATSFYGLTFNKLMCGEGKALFLGLAHWFSFIYLFFYFL